MSEDREAYLEKLRAAHEFPCEYTFKVIGDNTQALVDAVLNQVKAVLPAVKPTVSRRESAGGRHQSITLLVVVVDAEMVADLYERFNRLPGVRMLL